MAFFHGGSIMNSNRTDHIRLTSHPEPGGKSRFPIHWGAADPHARGPIIATVSQPQRRNVIGSHGGAYALYRALAVSAGGPPSPPPPPPAKNPPPPPHRPVSPQLGTGGPFFPPPPGSPLPA